MTLLRGSRTPRLDTSTQLAVLAVLDDIAERLTNYIDALDRAVDLDRAIDRAINRARALAPRYELDLARAYDLAYDLASDLDHDLGRALALARDRALALDLDHDQRLLDRALVRALDRTLVRARAVDRAVERAVPRHLHRAVDLDLDRAHAAATAARVAAQRHRSRLAASVDPARVDRAVGGRPPGRACRAVVAGAARWLPTAHQARYDSEWRAELWDVPRRDRLGYALRLLWGVPAMRRSLAFVPADGLERREPWEQR